MPVTFNIKITKEILERSKACGTRNDIDTIGNNCAIALALKDIFPEVFVTAHHIYPFGIDDNTLCNEIRISLPPIALDFIKVFDCLRSIPNVRLYLPEFEFEISIPEEILSHIDIDEINNIVKENSFLLLPSLN